MKIEIYYSSTGTHYVSDFLYRLPARVSARLTKEFEMIEDLGLQYYGKVKWLHGYRMQEIRVKFENICYRIFCVVRNAVCVLVHAFIKKSNSTPLNEIETALKRVKDLDFRLACGQYKFA